MILPSLYSPFTILSNQGSASLTLSILFLSLLSFLALLNLFNPITVMIALGLVALARVGYAMVKGE